MLLSALDAGEAVTLDLGRRVERAGTEASLEPGGTENQGLLFPVVVARGCYSPRPAQDLLVHAAELLLRKHPRLDQPAPKIRHVPLVYASATAPEARQRGTGMRTETRRRLEGRQTARQARRGTLARAASRGPGRGLLFPAFSSVAAVPSRSEEAVSTTMVGRGATQAPVSWGGAQGQQEAPASQGAEAGGGGAEDEAEHKGAEARARRVAEEPEQPGHGGVGPEGAPGNKTNRC